MTIGSNADTITNNVPVKPKRRFEVKIATPLPKTLATIPDLPRAVKPCNRQDIRRDDERDKKKYGKESSQGEITLSQKRSKENSQ